MDPFMVRLIKVVHDERIENYTKHHNANSVITNQTPLLQQLKEAFGSMAQKMSTKPQSTSVKPASRG